MDTCIYGQYNLFLCDFDADNAAHSLLPVLGCSLASLHTKHKLKIASSRRAKHESCFGFRAHECSESVLSIIAKVVWVWLLLLIAWAVWGGCVHWCVLLSLVVSDLVGLSDCLLDLLEGLFGLWVAVLIRVQLNGDLVVVLFDVLLTLLSHALDKQGQWRQKELVGQVHLIIWCLLLAAAIWRVSSWWSSSLRVDLLCNTVHSILRFERTIPLALLTKEIVRHFLSLLIQCFLLLLQKFSLVHFLLLILILYSWIEMLFLLHFNSFGILK